MSDFLIKKRLNELCKKGCIDEDNMITLFMEYEQDIMNNVPKEDSVARTILILGNMPLVHHLLRREFNLEYYDDTADEVSVGKFALVRAVDTFKYNNNIKFSTYAGRVIINEVSMYYRKINTISNTANRNAVSLEDCVNDEQSDNEHLHVSDFLGEEDAGIKAIVDKDLVDRIMKTLHYLNNREQVVIAYSFGLFGYPRLKQREIAGRMGVSRGYIEGLYSSGIKKLKIFALNEEDLSQEQRKQKARIIKFQNIQNNQIDETTDKKWLPKW